MNHSDNRLLTRSRLAMLGLVTGGVLGLLAACSSDGGNAQPSGPPVISTGGGGSGNGGSGGVKGEAGGGTAGGAAHAGSTGKAGSGSGGSAPTEGGATGDGGDGGEAGSTAQPYVACPSDGPTTDLGFLNRASTAQKSAFDNVKRLGAHAELPALP